MSVTSAMFTGVSGLQANGDAMSVIGNNISNVNTVGFKAGRSLFSDMLSETRGANAQVGRGVQMQAVENLFSQGSSQMSENVTDVSIQGNGFFAVSIADSAPADPTASTAYLTRAGAFHVDKDGYLVNPDGYKVIGAGGGYIQFTDLAKISKIDSDGTIHYFQNGSTTEQSDKQIAVVTVLDQSKLKKVGGSLFHGDASAFGASPSFAEADIEVNQVLSNSLEQSNVDMATEFVKMIVTQRAYSANSKTITTTDQMTQEVLGLIR